MPRESFRVRDLRAAIKAAQAAGLAVARYEVTRDGRIVIVPGGCEPIPEAVNPDIDADDGTLTDEHVRDAEI